MFVQDTSQDWPEFFIFFFWEQVVINSCKIGFQNFFSRSALAQGLAMIARVQLHLKISQRSYLQMNRVTFLCFWQHPFYATFYRVSRFWPRASIATQSLGSVSCCWFSKEKGFILFRFKFFLIIFNSLIQKFAIFVLFLVQKKF